MEKWSAFVFYYRSRNVAFILSLYWIRQVCPWFANDDDRSIWSTLVFSPDVWPIYRPYTLLSSLISFAGSADKRKEREIRTYKRSNKLTCWILIFLCLGIASFKLILLASLEGRISFRDSTLGDASVETFRPISPEMDFFTRPVPHFSRVASRGFT